jgi:cytoskeletal protein RodZ
MRSYRVLLLALALLFCLHSVAAAPTPAPRLAHRQEDNTSESSEERTATTSQSSRLISTPTPRPSSTSRSERPSTTVATTASSSVPSEKGPDEGATTTVNNDQPSASSSAGEYRNALLSSNTDLACSQRPNLHLNFPYNQGSPLLSVSLVLYSSYQVSFTP